MTDAERIAALERELAEERAERRRISETLRVMVEAQARREAAEAERKAIRSARNARHRNTETSPCASPETSQPPSPLLEGSPLPSTPTLPPPISSPQPLFSGSNQGDLLVDEKPAKPKGPNPEALRELWNRLAPPKGLQRWEAMGDDRKRLARLSLAACPDLARWEAWLTYELGRPFNLGETGWRADVDWLLRAKTRNLVLDFNPAVATATKTASGGDVPRLGPKPATPAPPAGDRPRL